MNEYLTPLQAIRKKCLECSNGQNEEVRGCLIETCPLYPYRIADAHIKRADNSNEQIALDFLIEY
jgi:hypothetical protein